MKKGLILVVWFVVFMALLTGSLSLISAPNTIENLLGVVVLAGTAANTVENLLGCVVLGLIVAISVETKCLTTIKLERKHEK